MSSVFKEMDEMEEHLREKLRQAEAENAKLRTEVKRLASIILTGGNE